MEYVTRELEGALFSKNEANVAGKGKILVNGKDQYVAIVKSNLPSGEEITELMISAGRIYANEKTKESQPDLGGNITINGLKYRFAGWQNVSQNGSDYISTKLTASEESPF
jgi:hypothetical protein